MKNKLLDLNDHLFAQLERLSDEDLAGDKLKEEISRSHAVTNVARHIVENGRLALSAMKFRADVLRPGVKLPAMLEGGGGFEGDGDEK